MPFFGGSLLMTVLLIVCLATFAALSLQAAGADYRLSRRYADYTRAYYEADGSACLVEAALSDFAANSLEADDAAAWTAVAAEAGGEDPSAIQGAAGTEVSFFVTLPGEEIRLIVRLRYGAEADDPVRLAWKTEAFGEAAEPEDTHLPVWTGEETP